MSRFRRLREDGEPVSAGRGGGVASYLAIFRNAMFTVLFFAGVMLINGLVAILVIGILQSLGIWPVPMPADSELALPDLSGRLWPDPESRPDS
jgi:hypothetical protein